MKTVHKHLLGYIHISLNSMSACVLFTPLLHVVFSEIYKITVLVTFIALILSYKTWLIKQTFRSLFV